VGIHGLLRERQRQEPMSQMVAAWPNNIPTTSIDNRHG